MLVDWVLLTSNINEIKKKIIQNKSLFLKNLIKWFQKNHYSYSWRETDDSYNVMIAELLLQRTRATNVIPVYEKFLKKFPSSKTLSKKSVQSIENTIMSLGIKSRAVKIKSIAKIIVKNYDGVLPNSESDLIKIFGKGSKYTVNAIRCFSLNHRVPIFDVNVQRIFERVFSIDFGMYPHRKKESWEIVASALPQKNVKQFNWALLDLGKKFCISNAPKCKECPLKTICDFGKRV